MVLVGAAACTGDGPGDGDPTTSPPSPTPTVDVDDPTASPTPAPGDGEILEGVFETGFEHSGFYLDAVCPEGGGSYWTNWTAESMFAERLQEETGVEPFAAPDILAFRVTVRGEVSAPGAYGHLGQYPREVTVFELIEAEVASDCGDDEPPDASDPSAPPAAQASTGNDEVVMGLGSYCWQGGAGQPGLCADMIGHITNVDPLAVTAGETVFLNSQLVLADAEVGLRAWPVENDEPLESGADWLAWGASGPSQPLAVLAGDVGISFQANFVPGLYVVSAFVVVPQGDVSYGLLLRVNGAPSGGGVSLSEPITLGVGQTASIEGSGDTLTFAGVMSDSRCAVDVQCVWAGEALLAFEVRQDGQSIERSLILGAGGDGSGVLGQYRLTTLALTPQPRSTTQIPPDSYEVTIVLDRLPPLPSGSGIEGVVTLGPLCPVMREGVPCPDRVYAATLVLLDANDNEVDRVTSGADGYYRLAVAPGQYTLVPQSPSGLPLPTAGPIPIEVLAEAWATVDVGYDSGIR